MISYFRPTRSPLERIKEVSAPRPDIPFGVYKRQQARISRHRLYPMTAFYTIYSLTILFFALRSRHPFVALCSYAAGIPAWTFVEYLFHRFVLHGQFPEGQGIVKRFFHQRLDPLHWEHHARPFDGHHINGSITDLLPMFFVAAPASFLAPIYTLPALLAGVVQFYVVEEWVHHSVHFYNLRDPYFRYMKRHHFYHHSPRGLEKGYGLTNGFWDIVFSTRFPAKVRRALYPKGNPRLKGKPGPARAAREQPPENSVRRPQA